MPIRRLTPQERHAIQIQIQVAAERNAEGAEYRRARREELLQLREQARSLNIDLLTRINKWALTELRRLIERVQKL